MKTEFKDNFHYQSWTWQLKPNKNLYLKVLWSSNLSIYTGVYIMQNIMVEGNENDKLLGLYAYMLAPTTGQPKKTGNGKNISTMQYKNKLTLP